MNSWVRNGCPYTEDDNGNITIGLVAEVKEEKVAEEVKAESKPKSTRAKTKKK